MKKTYHVVHRTDGSWAVKAAGASRASSLHRNQVDAVQAARSLAQQAKGELRIHGVDNRVREGWSYANESPVRLSESENIKRTTKAVTQNTSSLAKRIGDRLRRARLMAGYSLRGLALEIQSEVSHTMLQKFEAGEICPDTKLLARLGQTLHVRPDYFFKTDTLKLATLEYRSQVTKLGTKSRQRLEEQAYEFFERYLEIESILGFGFPAFKQVDLSGLSKQDLGDAVEEAANKLREEWQLGMNPIPNVHSTLENHGVKVRILPHEEGFDGFSAFAEGGNLRVPVIALSERWLRGNEQDLPRFRFTALHELAHLHLMWPTSLNFKEKESYCHRFAGAFLIPRKPFEQAFGVNRVKIALAELCAIKAEWGISAAAIMARANNLGLVTTGRYKTYCIVSAKNGWRTKDPGKWTGGEESCRFKPLVLRALAQELITTSKAAGLLGVSLPELGALFTPLD